MASELDQVVDLKPKPDEQRDDEIKVTFHPEMFRIISYVMFWIMVAQAAFITRITVKPYPYDDPENPLKKTFGYVNICVNWDYNPSLWITAMVYIPVELPLLCYIFLSWVRVYRDYRASVIRRDYYIALTVMNAVEFVLCTLFRMIFVIHAFDNVMGHTLGFMGLQVALAINAIRSLMYFSLYHFLTERSWQLWAGILYIVVLFLVTLFKLIFVFSIFTDRPIATVGNPTTNSVAGAFDIIWLILAGVLPLFFAVYMLKKTSPLQFTIAWSALDKEVMMQKRDRSVDVVPLPSSTQFEKMPVRSGEVA